MLDDNNWGVQPYCYAWCHDEDLELPDNSTILSFGVYVSGSGLQDDPMTFTGGNSFSCQKPRSASMYYTCYCNVRI